jgi:hypothetical protein
MSDLHEEAIFENQNILSVQFFSDRLNRARTKPLRRLACAVLIDAVHVFQTTSGTPRPNRRRDFNEAQEWLFGPVGHGPFSFESVCHLLDLEPSRLRVSLRRWQAMKREGQPCPPFGRRSRLNRVKFLAQISKSTTRCCVRTIDSGTRGGTMPFKIERVVQFVQRA